MHYNPFSRKLWATLAIAMVLLSPSLASAGTVIAYLWTGMGWTFVGLINEPGLNGNIEVDFADEESLQQFIGYRFVF